MFNPEGLKARVSSSVRSIEPRRILAPNRDLNHGPPCPIILGGNHYTSGCCLSVVIEVVVVVAVVVRWCCFCGC